MTRYRLTRRISGTFAALFLLAALLTGTAIAKPPAYTGTAFASPNLVSLGGQVRFDVSWRNDSGANLPSVSMTSMTPNTGQGAALVTVLSQSMGTCTFSASQLDCTIGTLNAGQTVFFSFVYRVPNSGTSFSPTWTFLAQGNTGSDKGGNSRGDDMPVNGSVALTSNNEIGTSYIYGDNQQIQTNQNLNKKNNPQRARVNFNLPMSNPGFAASVQEQPPEFASCPAEITTCFGNWTDVQANGGNPVPGGILVSLGYTSAPGNGSGVGFVHLPSNGGPAQVIPSDHTCANFAPPCINSFSSSQGNYFWELLLDSNGPMRGY